MSQLSLLTTRRGAALVALAGLLAVTGCGGSPSAGSPSAESPSVATDGSGAAISADRCAKNRAAGTITYLSGYQFQSSVSILEYIAAKDLGYFDDLCLDVQLKPGSGDTAQNTKLLASGQATISAVSMQDVIQARANGIDITGISSYSNAGLDILMTNPDVTDLKQLDGKVVGHKGYVPASVRAMVEKAGVDWSSVQLVKEGYDPSVLPRRQNDLAALTGFISNEPNQLEAAGTPVTVWQPVTYGIPSSIGAMAVNPAFAEAHPTAVEDVLRAALHAYATCSADAAATATCVGFAKDLSGATYDTDLNEKIWTTETSVVADNPTPGQPLGGIDPQNVTDLVQMLRQYDIVPSTVTPEVAAGWFDNSFVTSVYSGGTLVWPAP
ncbi:NitT/TauT family transport system substrate-binding protein [Quadrisphaera granulorum]|uniref:NitT/TauT family transport system substrate-binding protein n=1 Tax=Quadrisphaera granulorum TaxID=317664 RepID=A0A316A807_9ACTN|nr:ABC transporter substrate-binding protein [Quadrisphaera granulorum]PWJ53622.1 NitT/TauT family transport system substrate-binding protein [Quadrisphaera granulorum]SZE96666.1 NitT/TauT family transport system substrate-binding protein [Quadrisphaera granulorum]